MSGHEVTMAQAEIRALTELAQRIAAERDRYRRERDEARALLAHYRTSLAEQHNDPMQGGGAS